MSEKNSNENETNTPEVATSIDEVRPIGYQEIIERSLYAFAKRLWGHEPEEVDALFAKYLGKDYDRENAFQKKYHKKLVLVAEEALEEKLWKIKAQSTSLVDDNINRAMKELISVLGLEMDLSRTSFDNCKEVINRRASSIKELSDTCDIVWSGRRLFDWYNLGVISPEINSDILKMQDSCRSGTINREILASYYYNVALTYEKSSAQKSQKQGEHHHSVKFMKKALSKIEKNISLVMAIKDSLSDEYDYDPQGVLDACHRIMDNSNDDHSLYLAHKLYAETLAESKKIKGFSSSRSEKIIEHYKIALGYTHAGNDKLDILEAMSEQQKNVDKEGYIKTQLEIAELLTGRNRIRTLKNLVYHVDSPEIKAGLLKSAINEFLDLDDIRKEDLPIYQSLDAKLRVVAANEPKTIKKLDSLQKKFAQASTLKSNPLFVQMSSKGHDVFSKR
ncbi:MAG: hypothetical protein J6039_01255 [Alphaproteobacteria bacterium]|nr:hypothetical protein [Alphaproteobacteria bacterium]